MRTHTFAKFYAAAAVFLLFCTSAVYSQPGGPGGRPGGRPPESMRDGMRPGGQRDWSQMGDSQQAQQVKKKKTVKEGDTFKVVGELRDSVSGEFLAFVNVAVLEAEDSSFVKGAATNLDGLFEISGIPTGKYLLRVSAIGYQKRLVPFEVSNNTALGTLLVKPGATTLDAVEITAERPLYAMDGEKLVYNVSEDPSIQTGTTEDALQNAPGVEVDVEGNITLRGVSSVEIWINDKPSKLTEENLKTYLQTLPANALARIETITNPSAKYATDAEAVINIITSAHIKSNQFVSFGVNGSNQPFVSPWVSYMWAKEKWSINLFASGRYSNRENAGESWSMRRKDGSETGTYDTTMLQNNTDTSSNRSLSGNIFFNANYEIDSTSELSFYTGGMINSSNSRTKRIIDQTFYMQPADSVLLYTIGDTSLAPRGFGHIDADYTKKFDQNGHNLRIGFNSRYSRNSSEQYYDRLYTTYTDLDEHRYLLGTSQSLGASLDARYNRPYSEDGEMSYGLRADWSSATDEYNRYDDRNGTIIDPIRSYTHSADELSANVDVNWIHRWGGFTLSSGLGAGLEKTSYTYETTQWFADDSSIVNLVIRPSVHLTYRTEDMHNFKLNYSMHMSNPNESQLTTFRQYGNDSYSTGNIHGLNPSYTHNMEAGWQKYFQQFGNVGVEAYGRLSTNEISSLTDAEYDDLLDRVVSYSIPYNMGTSWRYGTSLNLTYRPSGFLNVRLYANVYDYGYRMTYDRTDENGITRTVNDQRDTLSWSIRINAWTKIYNKYQITAAFNYTSPTLSLMSVRKERLFFNIGARSDFFNRKLSVFVNIQDLFNWGGRHGSGSENTNPYYISNSTNKMLNSRYISAGITLRFGKMELERNAKDGSSETGDSL